MLAYTEPLDDTSWDGDVHPEFDLPFIPNDNWTNFRQAAGLAGSGPGIYWFIRCQSPTAPVAAPPAYYLEFDTYHQSIPSQINQSLVVLIAPQNDGSS